MKDRSISFYLHNDIYIYANFKASDGRLRMSTGITLSEGETIKTLAKHKKNKLASLEAQIDRHIGDSYLAGKPILKRNIQNIIRSGNTAYPVSKMVNDFIKAVAGDEITIKLQKKKNQVKIPLHPIAKDILEKYGYVLPKFSNRAINRIIKDVCKDAGFKERVLFTRTHGGQLVRDYKEKWELTTSHTMRRSFATNALKSGLKEWVIMAIGGWKSEASFKKYKRKSEKIFYIGFTPKWKR